MTTIAIKDGTIASDSLCCIGDRKAGCVQKIFDVGQFVIAGAGDLHRLVAFVEFYQGKITTNPLDDGDEVFVYDREVSRLVLLGKHMVPFVVDAPFQAKGSGSQFAIGAMAAGASAERAVEIASEYDIYSGGPVQVVKL